jgi:hypothetical protein
MNEVKMMNLRREREWFEKLTGFDIWGRVEAKLEIEPRAMRDQLTITVFNVID